MQVELNDRTARQVLDAITRHSTTVELADAVLERCRERVRASQKRLDETIESVLAVRDLDLPERYQVKLDGLTLHVQPPYAAADAYTALKEHAPEVNGSAA